MARLLAGCLCSVSLLAAMASSALAAPYSAEYVFGDSLSDRGNLAEAVYHSNFPNPPSSHDSFTNGPVAVQVLAQSFGLNADPSLWLTGFRDVYGLFGGASYVPGTNYAVAGATSRGAGDRRAPQHQPAAATRGLRGRLRRACRP